MGLDVIYEFKPDQPNEPGRIGIKFKADDKFSKLILNEITSLPSELKVDQFVFFGDKKLNEKFIESVFNLTDSLFKANSHRKEYKVKLKLYEKKFKRSLYKNQNKKNLDITDNPPELISDFDAFLTQIKASLDNLANGLNPLLRSNFDRWAKHKDKSGQKIINSLKRNFSKQNVIDNLIVYLEKNQDWITYIVSLRDKPLHKGGNSNLDGFVFCHTNRVILKPTITHPDKHKEEIGNFIDRTMKDFISFISTVLIITMQYNVKIKGLSIRKVLTSNGDTRYEWFS